MSGIPTSFQLPINSVMLIDSPSNKRDQLPNLIHKELLKAGSPLACTDNSFYIWDKNRWKYLGYRELRTSITGLEKKNLFKITVAQSTPGVKSVALTNKPVGLTADEIKAVVDKLAMMDGIAVHEHVVNGEKLCGFQDCLNQSKWVRYNDLLVRVNPNTGVIDSAPVTPDKTHLINFDFNLPKLELNKLTDDERARRNKLLDFLNNMVRPSMEGLSPSEYDEIREYRLRTVCWGLGAMIARNPPQWWLFLTGDSGVGKGSLIKFLQRVFGPTTTSSASLHTLGHEFTIASIADKALNAVTETGSNRIDNVTTQAIKQLASQEQIRARHPHGHGFEYVAKTWHIYSCNEMPSFQSSDDAFSKRFIEIECGKDSQNYWESSEKEDISTWLFNNADVVIGEFLRVYIDSIKEGWDPTRDPRTLERRKKMAATSCSVGIWCNEQVEKEEGSEVLVSTAFSIYREWMKVNGKLASVGLSEEDFRKKVKNHLPVQRSKKRSMRDAYVIVGIKVDSGFTITADMQNAVQTMN